MLFFTCSSVCDRVRWIIWQFSSSSFPAETLILYVSLIDCASKLCTLRYTNSPEKENAAKWHNHDNQTIWRHDSLLLRWDPCHPHMRPDLQDRIGPCKWNQTLHSLNFWNEVKSQVQFYFRLSPFLSFCQEQIFRIENQALFFVLASAGGG